MHILHRHPYSVLFILIDLRIGQEPCFIACFSNMQTKLVFVCSGKMVLVSFLFLDLVILA
jgi:hypothetical protein